jgi:hypothetical protein
MTGEINKRRVVEKGYKRYIKEMKVVIREERNNIFLKRLTCTCAEKL